MKLLHWLKDNLLLVITLFLLAFIPLYPKRPLLDIQHTWVYVRVEDIIVALVVAVFVLLLCMRRVTLKTPLTLPILLFWIIGGLATLHGVLLIFPTISNVFSNVAFLSYLRKIEYMSLFFVAFAAMKNKRDITYIIPTIAIVLLFVVGYGLGQRYFGFPAFLTMNEEFAKGAPIQLSPFSRIPSTFAGHYDLAAYLVLIIPLLVSIIFGIRSWLAKILLAAISMSGFILLFMTVSRVSFFVLALSLGMLLLLHKKRMLIVSLLIINVVFLSFFPSLLERFGNTVTEIDVLVDAKTGEAIGNVKETTSTVFAQKSFIRKTYENKNAIASVNKESIDAEITASASAVIPFGLIPQTVFVLTEPNAPTGENLPQGTGYVNLHLSPIKEKNPQFYYEVPEGRDKERRMIIFQGDFLIKRVKAYDLSYTTRFQGEWPHTINAFKQNIFLGSGYGSVSLAVDNNYLRILGESGVFGFVGFVVIFVIAGIYMYKTLPHVDSRLVRSFVFGFIAGTFGLALNGVFIDVFEASKIAFIYWLLMGVTLGVLQFYKKGEIALLTEFKKVITSVYAIVFYLFVTTIVLFSSLYSYYFVGDDFTWLRWAAECANCHPLKAVMEYFTQSNGFFFRPGTKLYFLVMYKTFWLNQTIYHLVSLFLHFCFVTLVFFTTRKIFRNYLLAIASAFLFLILSGYSEGVFWISSTGHLFNAVFALLSLLFYIYWKEKKQSRYLVASLCSSAASMLFHELGTVVPLLIVLYDSVFHEKSSLKALFKKKEYITVFLPLIPYFVLRFFAQSHWFNGDYSYNLVKFPFNFVGNMLGYFLLVLGGTVTMPLYQIIRSASKQHLLLMLPVLFFVAFVGIFLYRKIMKSLTVQERRIVVFSILFFVIALLPFIGLGNIAFRYSYLASFGLVMLFVFFTQKLYLYIVSLQDKVIATVSMILVILIFVSSHLFQLQKLHYDWLAAGRKSEQFLISLNSIYSDGWKKDEIHLYFVNVPIMHGDAWVFPVGLKDAVWFVFTNDNLQVHQESSVSDALSKVQDPLKQKVFVFTEEGNVIEKQKQQKKPTTQP